MNRGTIATGPESGLDTAHLFEFIGASQMDAWNTLVTYAVRESQDWYASGSPPTPAADAAASIR